MSIATKCWCGKSVYCTGNSKGCIEYVPQIPSWYYFKMRNMQEGFLLTLKVLKTFLEKEDLKAGLEKTNELIDQLEKELNP